MRLNFGILLLLFGATLAVGAGFLAVYLGAFRGVEVREVDSPAFTLLYKEHTGAYHKINDKLNEVEEFAKANGIPCPQTFGEFLDDPNVTEEGRLRANAGCVVGDGAVPLSVPMPAELKLRVVPEARYVQAQYAGSPAIGPWKVYPQVKGFMREHQLQGTGSNFEIYTVLNPKEMTTRYLFPLVGYK